MKLNLGGGFQNKDISKPSRSEKFIRLKNLYGVVGREGGVAGCSICVASQSPFSQSPFSILGGRGVLNEFNLVNLQLFLFSDDCVCSLQSVVDLYNGWQCKLIQWLCVFGFI